MALAQHEDVYLKGYGDGLEARTGIGQWIGFYNEDPPHQAHAYRTRWRYGAKA